MTALPLGFLVSDTAQSSVACAHCGAPLAPSQHGFCCAGCEGATC
jgi:hypothetical protein